MVSASCNMCFQPLQASPRERMRITICVAQLVSPVSCLGTKGKRVKAVHKLCCERTTS